MNVVLLLACGKLRQVCYHVHFPTNALLSNECGVAVGLW
jgi:hypothetical protein